MAHKSINSSPELALAIKARRLELSMTIEEAAFLADVGTKSWSRYEAGEPIRADKCAGVCRALNWYALPGTQEDIDMKQKLAEYRDHEAWSDYLAECYGENAALSFAIGSDILLDIVEDALQEIASLPQGAHIGQLPYSQLKDSLPQQFLTHYDYDFLYLMKFTIRRLRTYASSNTPFGAHTVLEELVLYLIVEESSFLMEEEFGNFANMDGWDEWLYELLGDDDLHLYLYNDWYLTEDNPFHFQHWAAPQFYREKEEASQ